jgi:transaldolase
MMSNFWKKIKALNPETEIWWDSSPLVWPNFKEDFTKSSAVPEADREWFRSELDGMFLGARVTDWIFDGCTTNPPLSWAVLKTRKDDWYKIIIEKRKTYRGKSKYGLFLEVYFEVVKRGAEKFMPLFEASGGKHGHISGQVDPQLFYNEQGMKEMAEHLADLSPNVMVKIPGSTQGIPVFKHLASKGIATNATSVFTVPQIMNVAKMIGEGRAIHLKESGNPRLGWRAVCTHMAGRLEDSRAFRGVINKQNLSINPLELRYASEAVVKKCSALFVERNLPIKMLVCSARLHRKQNGDWFYPHIEMFTGGPIVNTVPPKIFGGVMIYYKNREIKPNWDNPVPDEMIGKLSQVEYFRRAYDENGFDVEEFNEIPSLIENEAEFVGAAREMIEYVGSFI